MLRLESDAERIRIVTLHQSKGLEYPVTCLPFLGLPGASVRDWLRYHDADDRRVLDLQPQVKSLRPGAVDASERHQREQLQEDLRLAYVGMTRAKQKLHISHALQEAANGHRVGRPAVPRHQDVVGAHIGRAACRRHALQQAVGVAQPTRIHARLHA